MPAILLIAILLSLSMAIRESKFTLCLLLLVFLQGVNFQSLQLEHWDYAYAHLKRSLSLWKYEWNARSISALNPL